MRLKVRGALHIGSTRGEVCLPSRGRKMHQFWTMPGKVLERMQSLSSTTSVPL